MSNQSEQLKPADLFLLEEYKASLELNKIINNNIVSLIKLYTSATILSITVFGSYFINESKVLKELKAKLWISSIDFLLMLAGALLIFSIIRGWDSSIIYFNRINYLRSYFLKNCSGFNYQEYLDKFNLPTNRTKKYIYSSYSLAIIFLVFQNFILLFVLISYLISA